MLKKISDALLISEDSLVAIAIILFIGIVLSMFNVGRGNYTYHDNNKSNNKTIKENEES